jgi:hypothetical protein
VLVEGAEGQAGRVRVVPPPCPPSPPLRYEDLQPRAGEGRVGVGRLDDPRF